jgi:hypothetical protein
MREIKFRAWDDELKVMRHRWVSITPDKGFYGSDIERGATDYVRDADMFRDHAGAGLL